MNFIKANFSESEILNVIKLYSYNPDKVEIYELKGIANNNYRIKGKDFDIVVKVYSHGQSDENKIKKELEAMTIFSQNGINIPERITGKNGEVLQKYKGFNIVTTKFITGPVFNQVDFTETRMQEVGKIVGKVETISKSIDISSYTCMDFESEFEYVNRNLQVEISKRKINFNLNQYNENLEFVKTIIKKLDNYTHKQFIHKDIWPWNLIESSNGIYLLDFNDWSIGNPIIEISVAILEFSMFKSEKFDLNIARNILKGYQTEKTILFTPVELWESILFICYLYFPYNVIQADDVFESLIYLKRINTLLTNPNLIKKLF